MNVFDLPDKEFRRAAQLLKKENHKWPAMMRRLSIEETPDRPPSVKEIWRGKEFLAQTYETTDPNITRVSVNRTCIDVTNRRWRDAITWDDLQEVKRQVGFGNHDAVEVFPADKDLVNVANIRHLFVFEKDYPLDFIWRAGTNAGPGPA